MAERIFFALNLPLETKKEIIENYGKKLNFKGLKIVKEENIHITLLFLGYLDEKKTEKIKEKVKRIEKKKIKVKIKGFGSFNSKVIFLKIKEGKKEINELHEKICNTLEAEDERFHLHITIARNKKLNKKSFETIMEKLKETEFEKEIQIKSFDLMESVLSSKGPEYNKKISVNLL